MATYKDALGVILRSTSTTRGASPFRLKMIARLRDWAAKGEPIAEAHRFPAHDRMSEGFDARRLYRILSRWVTDELRGEHHKSARSRMSMWAARRSAEDRQQLHLLGLYRTNRKFPAYKKRGPIRRDSFFKRHTPQR